MALELPSGIVLLNPVAIDERFHRADLLNDDVNNATFMIGLAPLYDITTNKIYYVSAGNATNGWTFKPLGSGGSIEEEITVLGVGTVGGYSDGDVVAIDTSVTDFAKKLLRNIGPPSYIAPTGTLSLSLSTVEVGTTVEPTMTSSFTQNDGGTVTNVDYYRNSNLISNSSSVGAHPDPTGGVVIGEETIDFEVEISYGQGPIKNNIAGDPDPTGRIPAGLITATDSIVGKFKRFYGPVGSTPNTSAAVRALNSSFNNSFTLNTGTAQIRFAIAVPAGKTVTVEDPDVFSGYMIPVNTDDQNPVSGAYNKISFENVEDNGGTVRTYDIYVLSLASPYSTSHGHIVTVS